MEAGVMFCVAESLFMQLENSPRPSPLVLIIGVVLTEVPWSFTYSSWVAGTFVGLFLIILCLLHNIPEVFFSLLFPQKAPAFISVPLALLPVVLCDLPCSIFLLFSGFLPFIVAHFCSDWLSPSSQRGSISVSFPCLHFPPSPTAVPSLSRSYRPLSCLQHHPLPALFPLHLQPLSSITGGQQQRKQKTNQEEDVAVKNDCACEMPSIVSPALVWTAFIWLDELDPPARALTSSFQCFMPHNLSLHLGNFSLWLCPSLQATSSAAGMQWGENVHFIPNFFPSHVLHFTR